MMDRAYIASLLVTAVLINILYAQIIPPKIEEPLSTKTEYVKDDETFVLQCTAKGDPAPKYRWLKDGKDAPSPESMNRVTVNKDNGTLTISRMTSNEVGNYQCIADSLVPDGKGGQKMLSALSPFINVQRVYVGSDWPDPEGNSFYKTVGEYMGLECLNQPTSVPAATYLWYITDITYYMEGVLEDNRVYVDKKGTLHFVYVEKKDQPPTDTMYMCTLFNGPENLLKLGSPAEVVIQDGTPSPRTPVLRYRTSNEDAVFLMNTDAELECVFSGYDVPEITWFHQQVEIKRSGEKYQLVEDSFNRRLRVVNLKETDEGVVNCNAKNDKGDIEVFIHLDVTSAPIWVQGLSSQTVVEGRDAVFTCDARSAHGETPPDEPVWFMNGKPFQPDNSGKYEFSDRRRKLTVKKVDKLTDVNCFQCNVSNHMGYEFADGCLTIIQGIVVETKPNLKQEITFGQQINLTVVGKTDPSMTLKYKWRFNNVTYLLTEPPFVTYDPVTKVAFINTSGLTDEQYTSVAGIYYRELYHEYDRVVIPIEVILTDKPTAPIWVQGLSSQTVVEGRDAVFTCDARSAHGETPPDEPVWFMNGKPFQPDNSGKYEFSDRRRKLTVKKVDKLTDVNCFQCNVSNHMGYEFADGCLTIIQGIVVETKPNLKQEITFGQQINLTVVGKTDPSMTLKYKWRFNNVTYLLTEPPFVTYDPVTKVAFINTSGLTDEQYTSVAGIYYRELYHEYDRVVIPIEVILTDKPIVLPGTPAGWSREWLALIIVPIVLNVVGIPIVIICSRKKRKQKQMSHSPNGEPSDARVALNS